MKSQEVSLKKITETLRPPDWEFAGDKANTPVTFITRHWNWMNSYWNVLNRLPLWISLGEQFLWFSKNYLLQFCRIFLLFDTSKPLSLFFQIFLLRSIKAYTCPNMINFDGVNFSEHRSEKVISFFWRSVYNLPIIYQIAEKKTKQTCKQKISHIPFLLITKTKCLFELWSITKYYNLQIELPKQSFTPK